VCTNRVGQIGQSLFIKSFPGLFQARLHLGQGERDRAALLGLQGRVAQQSTQTFAQAAF